MKLQDKHRLTRPALVLLAATSGGVASQAEPMGKATAPTPVQYILSAYTWQPVGVGAGGYTTGVIISPRDPTVRYVKDDTHQAYRWDPTRPNGGEWIPMIVHHADGSGFRPKDVPMPSNVSSVWAIALNPAQDQTVYLPCTLPQS